jgi:hypothetical protein
LGLKIINEYNGNFETGIGAQAIFRIKKHGGLETGIYYKPRLIKYDLILINGTYNIRITENNIQLPILYRYDSKKLNFSVGPLFEYFLGWRDGTANPDVRIDSYDKPAISLGFTGGLSTSFYLTEQLIFEPEVRFLAFTNSEQPYIGLNIAIRKRLHKKQK